jgi:Uma2 family endonuclease
MAMTESVVLTESLVLTRSLVRPAHGGPWTLDDLQWLPDDGYRYEVTDGSLLVSPPPAMPHNRATTLLRECLYAQSPRTVALCDNVGIAIDRHPLRTTVRVPDIIVLHRSALDSNDAVARPDEVVVVVEVLSPDRAGHDQITKRHQYGQAGIRHYWIVDPQQRTLTVLRHDGTAGYDEIATVKPGTPWHTDEPFPLALDPADFT